MGADLAVVLVDDPRTALGLALQSPTREDLPRDDLPRELLDQFGGRLARHLLNLEGEGRVRKGAQRFRKLELGANQTVAVGNNCQERYHRNRLGSRQDRASLDANPGNFTVERSHEGFEVPHESKRDVPGSSGRGTKVLALTTCEQSRDQNDRDAAADHPPHGPTISQSLRPARAEQRTSSIAMETRP